eukprot:IDg10305t1
MGSVFSVMDDCAGHESWNWDLCLGNQRGGMTFEHRHDMREYTLHHYPSKVVLSKYCPFRPPVDDVGEDIQDPSGNSLGLFRGSMLAIAFGVVNNGPGEGVDVTADEFSKVQIG